MAQAIKTLTDGLALPTPISSRFCEWMDADRRFWPGWEREENLQAYAAIIGAFPDPFGCDAEADAFIEGDPRRHQTREVSFVAVKNGVIGLHIEQELMIIPVDHSQTNKADELVGPGEFADQERYWKEQLTELSSRYAGTEFFLAHGEHTYEGRLTLNAWTPFTSQPDFSRAADEVKLALQQMRSPYQDPDTASAYDACPFFDTLASELIDLSMGKLTHAA